MSEKLLEILYRCNDLVWTFNNNNALTKSVLKFLINWYAKVALFIPISKYSIGKLLFSVAYFVMATFEKLLHSGLF